MGQYYAIHNLDKKEALLAIASGVKLLEMASDPFTMTALAVLLANSNGRGGGDLYVDTEEYLGKGKTKPIPDAQRKQGRIDQINGRWAGDRIVFQGDYAKKGDPSFIGPRKLEGFTDITQLCVDALRAAEIGLDEDEDFQISKQLGRLK